jgi:hypothetical protein
LDRDISDEPIDSIYHSFRKPTQVPEDYRDTYTADYYSPSDLLDLFNQQDENVGALAAVVDLLEKHVKQIDSWAVDRVIETSGISELKAFVRQCPKVGTLALQYVEDKKDIKSDYDDNPDPTYFNRIWLTAKKAFINRMIEQLIYRDLVVKALLKHRIPSSGVLLLEAAEVAQGPLSESLSAEDAMKLVLSL